MKLLKDENKLWTGYGLAIVTFFTCIVIASVTGTNAPFQILICFFGGITGWGIGILASPFDEEEKSKFSDLVKGFLALSTGFVIAKLEPTIVKEVAKTIERDSELISIRISLFITTLFVGWLCTFVTRLYSESDEKRRERQRSALLSKGKKILKKLKKLEKDQS